MDMTGYLRKFVPKDSVLVSTISNLLPRLTIFVDPGAKMNVPWGKE